MSNVQFLIRHVLHVAPLERLFLHAAAQARDVSHILLISLKIRTVWSASMTEIISEIPCIVNFIVQGVRRGLYIVKATPYCQTPLVCFMYPFDTSPNCTCQPLPAHQSFSLDFLPLGPGFETRHIQVWGTFTLSSHCPAPGPSLIKNLAVNKRS